MHAFGQSPQMQTRQRYSDTNKDVSPWQEANAEPGTEHHITGASAYRRTPKHRQTLRMEGTSRSAAPGTAIQRQCRCRFSCTHSNSEDGRDRHRLAMEENARRQKLTTKTPIKHKNIGRMQHTLTAQMLLHIGGPLKQTRRM